ncbi:MAG: Transcriptional regulator, Crp/Fnr family [Thermodesulfobacterium sp. 37_54]|uniref:Crp/Fnr family transcriptional regulator n=1 Tax=Thermodesulfobacterium commune TaxID=1741 RepID=A0A117LC80_9BACT|nr:Crp/Fnr family transcriptional regulator [Thermodesulfobacterium commune]KUJ97836.1 MAG: Transcriptional regulator, Crp/Fnr family [Thermodesulfobacterium sp. 37_54]KUK19835.1 MAG: Transcriptional regulator, Crp/Fnr family [Thermodesulfobacterium commune]KUK37946.1 MAG: Transcriptional regulator, Crp/Fnr family [Thermodesulfobacterium commune]HAA83364.1 Crp/Fnr family transcriptional regulator [Thermodesulfobacterium commune]HBT04162.1 Crp/Fnr family transcriptional regulator [Thermodesulfo
MEHKVSQNEDLKSFLKSTFYFNRLSEDDLSKLSEIAMVKKFSKKEHIFAEGDRATGFYLVKDGWIKIYKLSPEGKEMVVHIFGSGEIFGEIVLAGVGEYPAWAQALTETEVIFFEKNLFKSLIGRSPDLCLTLLSAFAFKIKDLLHSLENITLKDAKERLLKFLYHAAKASPERLIKLEIPKSQLALLLGITPETFSRLLKKLEEDGFIKVDGKQIWVNDRVLT